MESVSRSFSQLTSPGSACQEILSNYLQKINRDFSYDEISICCQDTAIGNTYKMDVRVNESTNCFIELQKPPATKNEYIVGDSQTDTCSSKFAPKNIQI